MKRHDDLVFGYVDFVFSLQEELVGYMIDNGITYADLAEMIGCAPKKVKIFFSHGEKINLKFLGKMLHVLKLKAEIRPKPGAPHADE